MTLVVASIVPLVAFTLLRSYLNYQETVTSSAERALELTRGLSLAVEKELQARIASLQVLALARPLRVGDLDRFRELADAVVAEQYPGSNILLLREDGQQLMNTLLPKGAPLPVRPNLDTIHQVWATGSPAISNVYIGAVGNRYIVSIDVPVRRPDGGVAYVLSITPQVGAFADVIRRLHLPQSWVMSIFDRQGVNVARNASPERFIGQKAGRSLLQKLLTEQEGTLLSNSRDGFQLVTAFSHAETSGWAVAMGIPLTELTEPAVRSATRALIAGGAMLALGLILAAVVTRQITRPMGILRRLAMPANRDDLLTPPETGLSEADEVVQALHLAETGRRRNEREILERSEQLEATNKALESEILVRRQAEQKAEAQLGRLNLLHQITRAIGERQDLNSIFQVAVRSLEDQLPVDFGCLCLHDAVDHVLTVAYVGTKSGPLAIELAMPARARIGIDQNGLSRCVMGQLVYEPDIAQSTFPFPKRLAQGGLRSMVLAPLQVESRVFGVLVAARRETQSFSSGECEFLRQLSEHVALAAHQAQLYSALQQAYEDLRQTQQAIMQQERLRALGQMASGIAHDINNALSPVALYTQSLLEMEPNLSAKTREYLETIQRAVEDVSHTVLRMREFYRQREPQLALLPVHLNEMIEQVMDLTRARWSDMPQQRGIAIALCLELAHEPPAILGVESEIREALINLVFNAVDALPNGGTLTLRTKVVAGAHGPEQLQVDVGDDGAGMDEETRRRCLEPFFTTKGERGTGLGLAMVYGIVKRHNADIEIDSAIGRGTTVSLSFPVPVTPATAPSQPQPAPVLLQRLRLLLVDDDPLLLKSLRDALETEGHVVVVANGGAEGISAFKAARERGESFAAVITDLGMPNIDGRKVASAIKDASPATPVIMLTGWGQRLTLEDDIPPHVDRVLSKPPKLRELRETLAQFCGAGAR
jgi:signal transduction histidine kinase/ActR/RegA family two-component response regulator